MEAVFLIILLAVLVGVVWWRLNAKKSADAGRAAGQTDGTRATGGTRADGALSGGSAAASAEAAGTSGIASAAGFGRPAEPAAPTTADEPAETAAWATADGPAAAEHGGAGPAVSGTAEAAGNTEASSRRERPAQDDTEWETQWSEASGATPSHEAHRDSATLREGAAHQDGAAQQDSATLQDSAAPATPIAATDGGTTAAAGTADDGAGAPQPVHHPEYTAPQAPTLPGAETAAVEEPEDTRTEATPSAPGGAGVPLPSDAAAAETQDRTQSSELVETGADRTEDRAPAATPAETEPATTEPAPTVQAPTGQGTAEPAATEPAGHLAAEEPYGAGSASAAADGSGPASYTVKGDAGGMVYYEEGHPEYEQARADVWFESPAHAEAAGFRAPRRRRI